MLKAERVSENLNHAFHQLFEREEHLYLLGEDLLDPYGGAFKISKGLSTRYPERVLSTPISEQAIVGAGSGLALCGNKVLVEVMFGDFIALAFDQIINFASKSVTMYGRRLSLPLIVRCPVGGGRGYGPTHSQSLQKHFIGIPHLALFEMSPFHDNLQVFEKMLALEQPCLFFEDKILYTQRVYRDGQIDDLFAFDFLEADPNYARLFLRDEEQAPCLILAPGGLTERVLAAARNLFLELELACQILIPSQLYPLDIEPLLPLLERAQQICLVEESVAGGTWGSEIAQQIYARLWGRLQKPLLLINSRDSVIPTAPHLEKRVIVQDTTIYQAIKEVASV